MPIISNNSTSIQVDGAYVAVQSPQAIVGVGINSSLAGIVGTGAWGPLNAISPFSDTTSLYTAFGNLSLNITNGTPDVNSIAFEGYCATQLSNNFYGVRVDNGDSVAASGTLTDSASATIPVSAIYTGQVGNTVSITLTQGSLGSAFVTAQVQRAGYPTENFPNLTMGASGAFWTTLKNAFVNGLSGQRGPSQYVRLGAITSTHTPILPQTVTLAGGLNGTAPSSALVGTDSQTGSRTGVYVFRGTGVQQFILAGSTDITLYGTLATFAQSEASLALCAMPVGTLTAAQALTAKGSLATPYAGVIKDNVYIYDQSVNAVRLVSPLGTVLGHVSSLAPEVSPGNKPNPGGFPWVLATERLPGNPYSYTEAGTLQQNGVLYIGQMPRGGSAFGMTNGLNSAAVPGSEGLNYTRMTNYLALSIQQILGQYVDELQGLSPTDATRGYAKASLVNFLQNLQNQNRISDYSVQLDLTNNSQSTIAAGYCLATISVTYMGTIRFFVANLQGGATVAVSPASSNIV